MLTDFHSVEKQGGEIGVMSRAGEGSTFAFYIRARRVMPDAEANPTNAALASDTLTTERGVSTSSVHRRLSHSIAQDPATHIRSGQQSGSNERRFPILIVEDNVVNRLVLKKQLTRLGFVIYEANHGEEALSILQETRFMHGKEQTGKDLAIVLMDQEMPVMDGLTCVRRIRSMQEDGIFTRHVPVVAVTANARKEQIDIALDAGMDSVVCKPFRIPELVKQMDELLESME